jgi:hypothetical protein
MSIRVRGGSGELGVGWVGGMWVGRRWCWGRGWGWVGCVEGGALGPGCPLPVVGPRAQDPPS